MTTLPAGRGRPGWSSEKWAGRPLSEADQKRRRFELVQFRADHAEDFHKASAESCNVASAEGVEVVVTTSGRTYVSGIQRCGSVGCCPDCAPKIRGRRAADIEAAVEAAHAVGRQVWFLTLTIPHSAGDDLGGTLDRLKRFWRKMRESRGTRALWESLGVEGYIRAFEVTWSEANGWHPHIHVLLFTRTMSAPGLVDRWRAVWDSEGIGDRWVPHVSADIRRVRPGRGISRYLAKVEQEWGVGTEVARSDLKRGRGLTPPQLLELASTGEVCASGEMDWYNRWVEFEVMTSGLRWIEWSRGLRLRAAGWQIEATLAGVVLECVPLGEVEESDLDAAAAELREAQAAKFLVSWGSWMGALRSGKLGVLLWSLVCAQTDGFTVQRLALDRDGPALVPI